jgi:hypothetical protein
MQQEYTHLVRIGEFEFPPVPSPDYNGLTTDVGQEFQEKLPKLYRATT